MHSTQNYSYHQIFSSTQQAEKYFYIGLDGPGLLFANKDNPSSILSGNIILISTAQVDVCNNNQHS